MGIDTRIRNMLRDHLAPEAFYDSDTPPVFKEAVAVLDLLTDIHTAYNPETHSDIFTGKELYRWAEKLVMRHVGMGCSTVVVCIDDPKRVPKEKRTEQRARDSRRTHDPLPDNCEFSDGGVFVGSTGLPKPFSVKRMLSNRKLRPKFFHFLIERFQRWFNPVMPVTLILDHLQEGPRIYHRRAWYHDPSATHPYGEADLAMLYWVRRLHQAGKDQFCIRTTDSDMIPLLLTLLVNRMEHDRCPHLWVRYWRDAKKGERWMNANALYTAVTARQGWSVFSFVVYCCLCGTDFCDPPRIHGEEALPKKCMFRGITPDKVFQALEFFGLQTVLPNITQRRRVLVYAVRCVYTYVLCNTKLPAASCWRMPLELRRQLYAKLERMRAYKDRWIPFTYKTIAGYHDTQGCYIPSKPQLQTVYHELLFNIQYWMNAELHDLVEDHKEPEDWLLQCLPVKSSLDIPMVSRKRKATTACCQPPSALRRKHDRPQTHPASSEHTPSSTNP